LAFSINRGNMNEQLTLKPLEQKIISDFELSKFMVYMEKSQKKRSTALILLSFRKKKLSMVFMGSAQTSRMMYLK